MKNIPVEKVRTFALAGHGSSGKTSLIENLLYTTGANSRLGKVDDESSLCDYQDDEKQRKITINSKALHLSHGGFSLFVLDTPGYADFYGDTVSALRVADCTLIIVDASSGLQVGAMKAWKELEKNARPRAFFVNKLDKDETDFNDIVSAIQERFGKNCAPINIPIGSGAGLTAIVDVVSGKGSGKADDETKSKIEDAKMQLIEAVAESDDTLLEKYLGGETLSADEISKGFQKGIASGKVIPILCGSAEKGLGIDRLLEAVEAYFPSPRDLGAITGKGGSPEFQPTKDAPLSAFIFKTVTDPYIGHLTYARVFSGTLHANTEIYNATKNTKEKIGHLYTIKGKEQTEIHEGSPGDIVVIPKLKQATINDTFCSAKDIIEFPAMTFPQPTISFSINATAKGEEEKIATGLHKLSEDDPTLTVVKNPETHELVLSGLGDLHIDVMLARLKSKFHVSVEIGKPKVAYKETIRAKAEGHEKHKKQTGGRGQYGDVYLRIEPLEHGAGFEFVDEVVGGVIPKGFLPAIEKGIKGAMAEGILAGCQVVDIRVSVYDGSHHSVDSSEMAFKIAGSKAFKDAFHKAKPVLLEPIMNIEVTVPDELTGSVIGDLNGKRGRVQGMESIAKLQTIKAQVPVAEIFTYSNELRSMTGGQGSFTMEFSHYEEVPSHMAQKVIEEAKEAKEAEAHA